MSRLNSLGAIGFSVLSLTMTVSALAEPVPSNEELFRMIKEQQQTIKELRSELKRSRTQTAAAPARVPDNGRTAMAASGPMVTKAAPFSPAGNWSGFYIGAHGGYGWQDDDFGNVISVVPPVTVGGIESKGSVWGAQAGYNWQHGLVVAGLEIDFSASKLRGESAPGVIPIGGGASITQIQSNDVKYLGSARARVGYTPYNNFLFYATGGLAWERVDQITTLTTVVPPFQVTTINRQPTDWFGWVVGAGTEAKLGGSNWIGRIEYLHYAFDSVQPSNSLITNIPGAVPFSDHAGRQTIDLVRAAISYKFCSDYCTSDWGKGPVVTKY